MARETFRDTHAMDVPGMLRLLREIWNHIHPDALSPLYTIRRSSHPNQEGTFHATAFLHNNATRHNSVAYTFDSEPCTHARQAVQDAAMKAIGGLRTRDPEMSLYRRYAYFPRILGRYGECVFPVCPNDEDPALFHFTRYATQLTYHMADLHRTLVATRTALADSMISRAALVDAAALAAPPPPPTPPSQTVINPPPQPRPDGNPVGTPSHVIRISTQHLRVRFAEPCVEEPPAQRPRTSESSAEESDPEEPDEGELSPEPSIPGDD